MFHRIFGSLIVFGLIMNGKIKSKYLSDDKLKNHVFAYYRVFMYQKYYYKRRIEQKLFNIHEIKK